MATDRSVAQALVAGFPQRPSGVRARIRSSGFADEVKVPHFAPSIWVARANHSADYPTVIIIHHYPRAVQYANLVASVTVDWVPLHLKK
jgi:hypothetical protein